MKLDKRRKGVFGPPIGTNCIIFIDDLNMPALEKYGAQPPIEILRQYMDHGGWYDRSDNTFRTLVDIQFITAMGPPGGGRNPVTPRYPKKAHIYLLNFFVFILNNRIPSEASPEFSFLSVALRYLRHFNALAISEFDTSSMSRIFDTIMDWWIRKARIDQEITTEKKAIVSATIDVYISIQKELLPTPEKSHYTYNLRDVSKVIQGISMVTSGLSNSAGLIRLWAHECLRVFGDRLVNDNDRYLNQLIIVF